MAESTATATTATATDTAGTTETTATTESTATASTETKQENKSMTDDALEKIIQSRVDKVTAKLGKEKADALAALEQLKKDKMSADELAKYELEQEKKALADQKKELVDKANRLTGINELTKLGMYDGSETATALLDMVVTGVTEDSEIGKRAQAVKAIVDKLVSAEVSKKFKENGRIPNGGEKSGSETDDKKENSFVADLGKQAAERAKNSNEILNYYYGGKK